MFNASLKQILLICFMILNNSKYLFLNQLAGYTATAFILLSTITVSAQDKDSMPIRNPLYYYQHFAQSKPSPSYTKLTYTRPNNQLMSWPNYPLTAAQIEQRDKQWEQDNKLSNIIAKDIVTSMLSKKKKVAVIPKF
jgi:hypothetical protein